MLHAGFIIMSTLQSQYLQRKKLNQECGVEHAEENEPGEIHHLALHTEHCLCDHELDMAWESFCFLFFLFQKCTLK